MNEKIFSVTVKTRSKKSLIESFDEKNREITVRLKSPPVHNRANTELLKLLSKELHAKPSIMKGHSSKRKLVKLTFPKD